MLETGAGVRGKVRGGKLSGVGEQQRKLFVHKQLCTSLECDMPLLSDQQVSQFCFCRPLIYNQNKQKVVVVVVVVVVKSAQLTAKTRCSMRDPFRKV